MDEADVHPAGDKRGLSIGDTINQFQVGILTTFDLRVMAIDYVIGQAVHFVVLVPGGKKLESANTNVTGGDAGQNRTR
jgi:hypothetical protein